MSAIIGIYAIVNTVTRRRYIGSSIDVRRRCLAHFASLRNGTHTNRFLQRSWDKHGEECFMAGVVEECEAHELLELEQELVTSHGYYNLNTVVGKPPSRRGQHNTEEHRAKCSLALKGRTFGPRPYEVGAKISAAQIGHVVKLESRAKMRASHLGVKLSPEHSRAISEATKGRTFSPSHIANLSAAAKRRCAAKVAQS